MTSVSQQQLEKRWNTLSPQLREAIFSDINDDFILKLCQAEHLPDEKCDEVFTAASLVLFGFLHPEDLADELKDAAGLNSQVAATISDGINRRIFTPLKDDINKIFAPISKLEAKPKILQEIKPAIMMTGSGPVLIPSGIVNIPPPTPKLSGVGWSKSTPEQPVVKLSQAPVPSPQGVISSRVPPPAPKPVAIPISGSVGEFERIAIQKGAPQAPVAPAAPANPAPVIIHQDASFKPAQQSPNFRLQPSTKQFDMQKAPQMTTRPAVLELGNTASAAAARVIHYTEYKSPSPTTPVTPITPKAPPAPQGSRQITEIMPQNIPSQATAAAAQNKLIYKDYSEPSVPKAPPIPAPPPLLPKPDQSATKNT